MMALYSQLEKANVSLSSRFSRIARSSLTTVTLSVHTPKGLDSRRQRLPCGLRNDVRRRLFLLHDPPTLSLGSFRLGRGRRRRGGVAILALAALFPSNQIDARIALGAQ